MRDSRKRRDGERWLVLSVDGEDSPHHLTVHTLIYEWGTERKAELGQETPARARDREGTWPSVRLHW